MKFFALAAVAFAAPKYYGNDVAVTTTVAPTTTVPATTTTTPCDQPKTTTTVAPVPTTTPCDQQAPKTTAAPVYPPQVPVTPPKYGNGNYGNNQPVIVATTDAGYATATADVPQTTTTAYYNGPVVASAQTAGFSVVAAIVALMAL
ncbi:hypothetical protein HDV06_001270 [Boothiomyces sp. JEL0866]|nr:hypothetical protein HDV06_001270 [Boothiomyces sp. JEL0866]